MVRTGHDSMLCLMLSVDMLTCMEELLFRQFELNTSISYLLACVLFTFCPSLLQLTQIFVAVIQKYLSDQVEFLQLRSTNQTLKVKGCSNKTHFETQILYIAYDNYVSVWHICNLNKDKNSLAWFRKGVFKLSKAIDWKQFYPEVTNMSHTDMRIFRISGFVCSKT